MNRPRSFFEIGAMQRRRSALLLVAIGIFYFLAVGSVTFSVRAFFWMLAGPPMHRHDWAPQGSSYKAAGLQEIAVESASVALVVGGLLVLVQYWFARRHAVSTILSALRAADPDDEDRYHRRFRNLVEEMSIASGLSASAVRPVVMPSVVPAAFAAQDVCSGAIVGVSEGLLGLLNRNEVQAVVAHEMVHVREGDAAIAAYTCALMAPFLGIAECLERAETQAPRDTRSDFGTGLAAGAMLASVAAAFMRLACTTLSRERETLADAGAVELTRNPLALASALSRLSTSNTFLGGTAAGYAPIFILDPSRSSISDRETWSSNLFSSHPPVSRRIATLLHMAHTSEQELNRRLQKDPGPDGDEAEDYMLAGVAGATPLPPPRSSAAPAPWLGEAQSGQKCPACRQPLYEADYEGARVGHCPECGGYLVPTENLPRILARNEMVFGGEFQEQTRVRYGGSRLRNGADLAPEPEDPHLNCPACIQSMTRQYYSYQWLIVVDRCYGCNLTWFGPDELEALQVLIEGSRS